MEVHRIIGFSGGYYGSTVGTVGVVENRQTIMALGKTKKHGTAQMQLYAHEQFTLEYEY